MTIRAMIAVSALASAALLAGCSDDEKVSSEEEARLAYMGLDVMVGKAMDLGFAGFNAAKSANIAPQSGAGTVKGTLQVTGQVDQGASANKGMRLQVALTDYQDDGQIKVVYATDPAGLPALTLNLKSIPTGTLSGTLAGGFSMSGDLKGVVTLALTMSGQLQADPADATRVQRKPGTTRVTGTAQSTYGAYVVDITR
jgi:hypothetical protein